MDLQEEFTQIMKGKRTKRPRQSSPLALTMASTSSSSMAEGGSIGGGISENSGGGGGGGFDRPATASATNSGELMDHSVEKEVEEDMANCLILLAQGHRHHRQTLKTPERPLVPTTYYQCKTCDRCFPSFQALGGHRASHNKPNKAVTNGEEKKPSSSTMLTQEEAQENSASTTLSLQIIPSSRVSPPSGNTKSRVHECSICGAEFSSGQALGGHMRRHRSAPAMATSCDIDQTREVKKSKNVLALDLNLPAPEDEHRESKFVFASKKQVIVFSASPLVDCHY
ncbi:hypothetical protein RHGRI_007166 [Rhododendron griersonianum]|uniref:C2H2-type domain-containing protein n=1 Tax=Rhododendron griersonianum TaxID=479676 RepID=A0AAV6KX32_9ERIC|nr:hypothetical protein RHGRI_007166 [Rhododendron griersonianum]